MDKRGVARNAGIIHLVLARHALETLAGREHDGDAQELHILFFVVDAQSRHVGVRHKRVILF